MSEMAWQGLIVFLGMFALIMIGIPIYLSMLVAAMAGFWWLAGPNYMTTMFFTGPYSLSATYNFCVIPLFMIVGELAADTGMAGSAFVAMRVWLGKLRGGLLMATIGANLIFGAPAGASANAIIVFGKVAYPELVKNGYDKRLSMATIAATSALSSLIPPSTTIVMWALLANISVGRALMAGIGPGVIVAILYCLMGKVIEKVQPHKIPPVTEEDRMVTWKQRGSSLKLLVPITVLMLVIVGGTYVGWFPATVGGAIGAMACVIYAFAVRTKKSVIWKSFQESAVMFSQVFPMMIAGTLFSRVIALSGLTESLARVITHLDASPFIIFTIVIVFYLFCGCVMDILATIIITVPIVFPLLTGLGYDPYVICIVLVFMCEIAGLTPPIGMNVFSTSAVLRINPIEVFKGIIPYFIVDTVMVFLMVLFPQITTFLPNLFGGA